MVEIFFFPSNFNKKIEEEFQIGTWFHHFKKTINADRLFFLYLQTKPIQNNMEEETPLYGIDKGLLILFLFVKLLS